MRTRQLLVGAGVAIAALALLAPAAAAQTGGCAATANRADVRGFSQPSRALKVARNGTIAVSATTGGGSGLYSVALEFSGIRWTVAEGSYQGGVWSDTVNVKDYASYGEGLYKVVASSIGTGPSCFARAYVKVGNSNPLDTVAGAAGAGGALLGALGAGVAGRGGKQFDGVESTMDDVEKDLQAADELEADEKRARERFDTMKDAARSLDHPVVGLCGSSIVAATGLTMAALAQDATREIVAAIGRFSR